MKLSHLLTAILTLALFSASHSLVAAPPDLSQFNIPRYAPDRILVKFKAGTPAAEMALAHRNQNATALRALPEIAVQVMQVPSGTVEAAVAGYQRNPNVLYAEPDYYRLLVVPQEENPNIIGGTNLFDEQWYLHNTGQDYSYGLHPIQPIPLITNGSPGADINAVLGWDLAQGQPGDLVSYDRPKIAVLDSGADCATLELSGKCLERVNFTAGHPDLFQLDPCPASNPNYPVCDNLGHGTFTAGEAVANTDNGEGLAGVGWHTGAGIYKVCYPEMVTDGINLFIVGLCPVSGSADAIVQAASDQFAGSTLSRSKYHVITMSYGSDLIGPDGTITPTDASTAECAAIEYARDNGVLVVAAAGNNGDTTRVYPAACTDGSGASTLISVAASDHHDDRANFSTFSYPGAHWVTMAAPGQDIVGLQPDARCNLPAGTDTCVDWWSGTSMSAPLVAGAAALVWSDLYTRLAPDTPDAALNPALCEYMDAPCNEVVRQRLQNNAAKLGANNQDLTEWTEHGRLDLYAALSNDYLPPPGPVTYIAAFSYSCSRLVCSFDAGSSQSAPPTPLSYAWLLTGPGLDVSLSSEQIIDYSFPAAGLYTVSLTVPDDPDANSASVSVELELNEKSKKVKSGSVSSDDSGGGDGGSNCPPAKAAKGKC